MNTHSDAQSSKLWVESQNLYHARYLDTEQGALDIGPVTYFSTLLECLGHVKK